MFARFEKDMASAFGSSITGSNAVSFRRRNASGMRPMRSRSTTSWIVAFENRSSTQLIFVYHPQHKLHEVHYARHVPNVVDRMVQQAMLQVMEPIFEPTFHPSSHGFRPKRGAHTAIAEATGYLKDGYQTVVDLDLAKFFDRVHHQRLLARIAERVKDPRIVTLVRLMLKAAVIMPDGTKIAVQEGTPQGGPLSPLPSNIVLNELDGELARRGLRFVRYADDCNIFVWSERAGQRVMTSIRRLLEQRMRLQVNEEKSDVRKPDDVHFLGFRFRCGKEGDVVAIIPSRKAEQRLKETNAGDDATKLGALHHDLHGRCQPLPDWMDIALPAMHAGCDQGVGRDRRPHPPPDQGD